MMGPAMSLILYDYWRSSAAYRTRIALNLKGAEYNSVNTDLANGGQREDEFLALNPQGFVPALAHDGGIITQSLAIIEWLDAHYPEPRLIPAEANARADIMAKALVIAADIHPINNLRILNYLKNELGHPQGVVDQWIRHWIGEGFAALEVMVSSGADQPFIGGDTPGLADICLVPQMYNARRFGTDLTPFPRLVKIDAACTALPAFVAAQPRAP
jgi:maleylacetoacetate isomerase